MMVTRRALGRAVLLRSSASLSPLPPSTYRALSNTFAAALSSGEYLKTKPKSKEGEETAQNPFEAANMDGAMEGMKKQAVMMCVFILYPAIRKWSTDGDGTQDPEYGDHAVHLGILLELRPQCVDTFFNLSKMLMRE
jgi:hypothetical protein